ncbi:MAG TPA: FAD-binding protein [Syntrophorhabdaceae bacterium]|nr:FAD-binding protein [Syntrophorhabdaceae bacterium]
MAATLEQLSDGVIETDFLIIGGGLVGSLAAIRARKNSKDLDITVIDKATMEYSGDGVGLDNFNQIPLHKEDMGKKEASTNDVKKGAMGTERYKGLKQAKLAEKQAKNTYVSVPLLEEIGVKLREDDGSLKVLQGYRKGTVWGRIEYDEHGKPYEPLFGTLSRGSDLKMRLGTAVRKAGVRILDRTMVTSIVTNDGKAIGATAINVRTGKFLVFKAKTLLLATGMAARLYPYPWAPYPNNLFYTLTAPMNHGGGHICALDAGAKLWNMEINIVYNVSKGINHSSGGGACNWYFKMYNSKGEYLEDKYPDSNVTKMGGMIPGVNFLFSPNVRNSEYANDVILSAKNVATDDDVAAVYFTAATEPTRALKFHKLAGGLTNERPAECVPVLVGIGMQASGGVFRENEYAETGVKNLFAGGTVSGGGSAGSHGFTWACLIADHVTELVKCEKLESFGPEQLRQVELTRKAVLSPLSQRSEYRVNPLELEDYVRNVNYNYVGIKRVKAKMDRAIELLRFAYQGAVPLLYAGNPHELMRALEVKDIIQISELHAQFALRRTESRMVPAHYRDDYPEMDPAWDDMVVTAQKIAGEIKYDRERLNKE